MHLAPSYNIAVCFSMPFDPKLHARTVQHMLAKIGPCWVWCRACTDPPVVLDTAPQQVSRSADRSLLLPCAFNLGQKRDWNVFGQREVHLHLDEPPSVEEPRLNAYRLIHETLGEP
jgi:hypothetical protein